MLCPQAVGNIFPFHVFVDEDLIIRSIGKDLPTILGVAESDLIGNFADSVFSFIEPDVTHWSHKKLVGLENQDICLEPFLPSAAVKSRVILTGSVAVTSRKRGECLLILTPNETSLRELNLPAPRFGLTRPSSVVEVKEPISPTSQLTSHDDASSSHKSKDDEIKELRTSLHNEQALLESLIPKHAAQGLRKGKHVDPVMHENVTMFFSDISGFTNMCDKIYPWEIIGVLNRLYCIMDHLASKFGLFKIETIGDAYVCAAGLPTDDPDHAEKVATFALAVSHCARHIVSPVDNKPLQLRVGIHTGSCASGVVGVTNPRYCVFGDTVNMASRHESTGEADRVQTSEATMLELMEHPDKFLLTERGRVDMKGKGSLTTYWLTAKETNPHVNADGLAALDAEVKQVLYDADIGSKERCSKNHMESFSPRKMQKVALSLDKLAMDVLRRASQMNQGREAKVPFLNEPAPAQTLSRNCRDDSLSFSDIDEETKLSEATDQVFDDMRSLVDSFYDLDEDVVKDEIARALSSSFASMNMSQGMLLELDEC